MRRSLFLEGNFQGVVGQGVKPITLAVYSYDIPRNELKDVLKRALPIGWTGTSPQVVKTLDGEYLIYADGSAQFVPLGRAPSERFQLGRLPSRPRIGAVELIELGRTRKRLGQLTCCNAPDGKGYCFDTGTGECSLAWISQGAQPGSPACVQNDRGEWVHPSCEGLAPEPSPGRPELPPGCRYVAAPDNPMQEVICEGLNCRTQKVDRWRGFLSDFLAAGGVNPVLVGPEWVPIPGGVCNGDGAPPPPDTAPAPTDGAPPPADEEPTKAGPVACPDDGRYDLYDTLTGDLLLADVAEGDLPEGVEVVDATDPRCGPVLAPGGAQEGAPSPGPGPGPAAPPGGVPGLPTGPLPGAGLPGAPSAGARRVPGQLGPVSLRQPRQGPFPQTFYPCGAPSYMIQDLATVTQEHRSPADFEPRWRRTW